MALKLVKMALDLHEAGVNHKIIQLGFVEVGTNVEIGTKFLH